MSKNDLSSIRNDDTEFTYLGFKKVKDPYNAAEAYGVKLEQFIFDFVKMLSRDSDESTVSYVQELYKTIIGNAAYNNVKDDKKALFSALDKDAKRIVADLTSNKAYDLLAKLVDVLKNNNSEFELSELLEIIKPTLSGIIKQAASKNSAIILDKAQTSKYLDTLIESDIEFLKKILAELSEGKTSINSQKEKEKSLSKEHDQFCEGRYEKAKNLYQEFLKLNEGSSKSASKQAARDNIVKEINKIDDEIKERVKQKNDSIREYYTDLISHTVFEGRKNKFEKLLAENYISSLNNLEKTAKDRKAIRNWMTGEEKNFEQLKDNNRIKDLKGKLERLYKYEHRTALYKISEKSDRYCYYITEDGDNKIKAYIQQGENKTLLFNLNKPETFHPTYEGKELSLHNLLFSPDGKYAVYTLSINGTDEGELWICDVDKTLAAKKNNPDSPPIHITEEALYCRKSPSMAWAPDSKSLYYTKEHIETKQSVGKEKREISWYEIKQHYLHEPFKSDKPVITSEKDSDSQVIIPFTPLRDIKTGEYSKNPMISHLYKEFTGSKSGLTYYRLNDKGQKELLFDGRLYHSDPKQDPNEVRKNKNGNVTLNILGEFNGQILTKTNHKAPNSRVVLIDPNNPSPENWIEVVKEKSYPSDYTILFFAGDKKTPKLFINYMADTSDKNEFYDLKEDKEKPGGLRADYNCDLTPPTTGPYMLSEIGYRTPGEKKIELIFSSMSSAPSTIYEYDLEEHKLEKKPKLEQWIKRGDNMIPPNDIICERIWTESRDGTRIPMTVMRHKDTKLDGTAALRLYGYGGFRISLFPSFEKHHYSWVNEGGINVGANLRGGGEYGDEWYSKGKLEYKQNVYDDFIACAEALQGKRAYGIGDKDAKGAELLSPEQRQQYTCKERLMSEGSSNGGLLTTACALQRPDLFGAVSSNVPVMDMLRYNKFSIAKGWERYYGEVDDNLLHHLAALDYSPVHHIAPLPKTLIKTGECDDRVDVSHTIKFAALYNDKLQGKESNLEIMFIKNSGHSFGTSLGTEVTSQANSIDFAARHLGPINQKDYARYKAAQIPSGKSADTAASPAVAGNERSKV